MFQLDSIGGLVVLVIAALFAYVFILRKLGPPNIVHPKPITKETTNKTNDKNMKERKNSHKTTQENPSSKTQLSCMHEFGHLGSLPRNSKIPDECLGCSRIMKCLAEGRSRPNNLK